MKKTMKIIESYGTINFKNNYKNLISLKHSTTKYFSSNTQRAEKIYEYKISSTKLRILFWGHMAYIYGNSALLYLEIFDPTIGYFHGLMLTLSLAVGWTSYLIIGNILKRTVHKIYKISPDNNYRIEYLSFLNVGGKETVNRYDLVEYTQSNIEGFYFVRNRPNKYKKIYVNVGINSISNREFQSLMGQTN